MQGQQELRRWPQNRQATQWSSVPIVQLDLTQEWALLRYVQAVGSEYMQALMQNLNLPATFGAI